MTSRGFSADGGAGTVLMVAVTGFAGLLICVTLALGQAVVTRHRAGAAADLAALAAASSLAGGAPGADACARARVVARANGGALVACSAQGGGDVIVRVEAPLGRALIAGLATAGGSARAGPPGP